MQGETSSNAERGSSKDEKFAVSAPSITLPKGGGAISGIGEKFAANPVTGTGSMTVPITTSPGRSGFGPQLSLSYDSGAGNGPFGFGWNLSVPSITRRTDRGLPKYDDAEESDVFTLSGAEDLVPVLVKGGNDWQREILDSPSSDFGYVVHRYRPRIEGLFARIERWVDKATGLSHWRSISKDNITTLYGKSDDARIADSADSTRVFKWLISESYDDKGNAIHYGYKPEGDDGIDRTALYETSRLRQKQFPQRYLKTIFYGNRIPRDIGENLAVRTDWLFEVVFDYGEHDKAAPTTKEVRAWPARLDPFSLCRSTFDVRTYRLCRRVLMFHHLPEELNGTYDYLVRSTDFEYKESTIASFITSITQAGYAQQPDRTYFKKALPKLEFQYTEVRLDETVHELDPESIENLPQGVDGAAYQWVDLDSEGLTGVLTDQAGAWYYKRNLGNGTFGSVELVARKPSGAELGGGRQQLLDITGEGHLSLVEYNGPMAGFQERTSVGNWDEFTPFRSRPDINTKDPNVRFLDVTGNGHSDILISEDTVFTWYESLGKEGFAPARCTPKSWDEEKGAKLVFADVTKSIFTADMVGDGLSDIVRIRCGEICYWPNLGYGRFGAKVIMGNAPIFDRPDLFDPRRIHLADIDGSGNADIIYVGSDGVVLYFNQSGNSWSSARQLTSFPPADGLSSIATTDLLGNGTACLVWSSPLASDRQQPMRYIDLMGGQKPHLLVHTSNNMGAETDVQYAASTKFYLQDRREGRPWVTKLAFPVHVIERVENRDLVSNTKLVSTYRYRHGYFDGFEREFRGFAHVEQRDTESVSGQFDLSPVVTKTWFHTGALLDEGALEAYFKNPANQEFFAGDPQAAFLPDPEPPPNQTADEMRETARALKGSILRQEVYSDDGSPKAALPYSVSEHSYGLTCLQPRGPNHHAVFFSHPRETIDYHYERNPADPRISHVLTLAVDDYGNVLKTAAIGYQRRTPAFEEQGKTLAILTESQYTNAVLEDNIHRTPLPAEVKTFELTAPTLAGAKPLGFSTVDAIAAAASEISYEVPPSSGQTQKRLIGELRMLYRTNDLSALLPAGRAESMGLPGESYKLALTPGLLDIFRAQVSRAELTVVLTGPDAGYRDLDGDGRLWVPSGRAFYSPNSGDDASQELAFSRVHFFLPHRYLDPFGNNAAVAYDAKCNLLLVSTRDAVGNQTFAEHDYRVLQPRMVTDPNGNRTEARFDALGILAATALCGKVDGPIEGDSFAAFETDLSPAQRSAFFNAADPRSLAVSYLGTATTRILYDLERVPVCAAAIARETHVSDLAPGTQTKIQLHLVYSDGFGREAQTKAQAEPGPLNLADPLSPTANPRWIGTGEKIYNNKGRPIRRYEPFFSTTPQFSIENWGVSSTLFYDPVERVVATLHPNHTFEKVVFDPWQRSTFDVNDTVTFDPQTDPDIGEFFGKLPDANYLPTWYHQRIDGAKGLDERTAAEKAAKHVNTPGVVHFDCLGRAFLTIADNGEDAKGADQKYRTRTVLDIEGQQREVIDALDRVVMRYDYDMLKNKTHQASMDAGERWMLDDAIGKPIRSWDSRGHRFRNEYDQLRRPARQFVQGKDPARSDPRTLAKEVLFGMSEYGEGRPDDTALNLRTRLFRQCDGAGVVLHLDQDSRTGRDEAYDFKGNLLRSTRQLIQNYKGVADWSAGSRLEPEVFHSAIAYDALNRPITLTEPDGSVTRPGYNEANLLETLAVLKGATPQTMFVTNIDYDAKGQRTLIEYGNHVRTEYEYDPQTFRLIHLYTARSAADFPDDDLSPPNPPRGVQNLRYTYDPAGNITNIRDDAQQTVYYKNQVVPARNAYKYDALYRLIDATGREHIGQAGTPQTTWDDQGRVNLPHPQDGQAMRNYTEIYQYDEVGNFLHFTHQAQNGNWSRDYICPEPSLIEADKFNNRLGGTIIHPNADQPISEAYHHDAHGNMISMPHLGTMSWDLKDQFHSADLGGGGTVFYVYDASGQRVRTVWEKVPGLTEERIYLGGLEIFRRHGGPISTETATLERETLHVMDDKQRIALVETRTLDTAGNDQAPRQIIRYQFGNHLGSATLELDEQAQIISYEEYAPYGSSTYLAVRSQTETAKRYRYTGKERDDETGLYYHGARYYACWLARWTSADPAETMDGVNVFAYANGNPIKLIDPNGQSGIRFELGDKSLRTETSEARLMGATELMVGQAETEFREQFGLATTTQLDYGSFLFGDGAVQAVTLNMATREKQDETVKAFEAALEQRIRAGAGKAETEEQLGARVNAAKQSAKQVRDYLISALTDGDTVKVTTNYDFRGKGLAKDTKLLVGLAHVGDKTSVNPFTFYAEEGGGRGMSRSSQASSSRAQATLGPGMLLLHETEHVTQLHIDGRLVERPKNIHLEREEQNVSADVDKTVQSLPGLLPRSGYGGEAGKREPINERRDWFLYPEKETLESGLLPKTRVDPLRASFSR